MKNIEQLKQSQDGTVSLTTSKRPSINTNVLDQKEPNNKLTNSLLNQNSSITFDKTKTVRNPIVTGNFKQTPTRNIFEIASLTSPNKFNISYKSSTPKSDFNQTTFQPFGQKKSVGNPPLKVNSSLKGFNCVSSAQDVFSE